MLNGGLRMNFNVKLLGALKERGISQRGFARMVGEPEAKVSRVINGLWNIDQANKQKYAKVLGLHVEDIFPEA